MTRTGHSETVHFEKERGVTEVAVTRGVAHATVELPCESREKLAKAQLGLLQDLAAANIPIFLIKLHPNGISFAMNKEQVVGGSRLLHESGAPHVVLNDLALVSTIAGAMRDLSGVIANIYEALVGAGIPVRQTSDAYNAVLCLVSGNQADLAVQKLRECFALSGPSAELPEIGEEADVPSGPGSVQAL